MSKSKLFVKELSLQNMLSQLEQNPSSGKARRRIIRSIQRILDELRQFLRIEKWNHYAKWAMAVAGITLAAETSAQSFQPRVDQPFGLTNPFPFYVYQAIPADVDADGDLDLVVPRVFADSLVIMTNVGTPTLPQFAGSTVVELTVAPSMGFAFTDLGDIDGDGDLDLVNIGFYGDIQFAENKGSASNFQMDTMTTGFFGLNNMQDFQAGGYFYASTPQLVDLDGDGDLDLIVGAYSFNQSTYTDTSHIFFAENTGSPSNPSFGNLQTDPFGLMGRPLGLSNDYPLPCFGDFDLDGDQDMIMNAYSADTDVYFENNGSATNPNFNPQMASSIGITTSNYTLFSSGDIDSDGDLDLFGMDLYSRTIFFHENQLINIGVEESPEFKIYPNPVSETLFIENLRGELEEMDIISMDGKRHGLSLGMNSSINVGHLPSGTYLLRLVYSDGTTQEKIWIKE